MANNEHVALLGQGASAWNEWRAEFNGTPDLSRGELDCEPCHLAAETACHENPEIEAFPGKIDSHFRAGAGGALSIV
jgi:hypothetical protein